MKTFLRFWTVAAMGLAGLAVAGCSSSEKKEDPAPTYKYPDKAAFCAGLGVAVCSTELATTCVVDKAVCQPNMQKWACESYTGVYRKEVAEDCVKAWESAYADATLTGGEQANINKVCELVFGGTGGTGAACTSLKDCDLDQELKCVKGKCEIPKAVTVGEDCAADDLLCAAGLYCSANDKICAKRVALAGECTDTKPCQEDLQCVKAAPTDAAGTCQAKTADGGTCTTNAECMGGLCTQTPLGGDAGVGYTCASTWEISKWDPFCSITKSY